MRQRWVLKKLTCDGGHTWDTLVGPGKSIACPSCGLDGYRPDAPAPMSATVIGDELWGGARFLQNLDTTPVWVETKSQYRAELAARGFENRVRHMPTQGTDKSEHTTNWNIGPPRGFDPRPYAMLTVDEQAARRQEASTRLGFTVDELANMSTSLESLTLTLESEPKQVMTFTVER